ncbi:hypothetical protein MKX01_036856 [Papaver californicum]|nr:hypothetical protein MKX01_036856 [Papaver californicum]
MEFIKFNVPQGLRVLAVDNSSLCLEFLEKLLKKCRYEVTTALSAHSAFDLLRKKEKSFDIVITDAEMDDGFRLLEIIGLEMDIPVIMMTTSNDRKKMMKGIEHGVCGYLVKPPSLKEIQNIWQYVIISKHKSTLSDQTKSNEDKASGGGGDQKVTRISLGDPELHAKFVEAFYKLGEEAVPSTIVLEMNVPGLTCEHVASHLQVISFDITLSSNVLPSNNLFNDLAYHPPLTGNTSSKVVDPYMVTSSKLPDHNANIDSRASNFQFGETSNVLPNNNPIGDLANHPPMVGHKRTSSNLNPVFQNDDYSFNMTDHSTLPGYDELRNMVAPTVLPSTNAMESQRVDQMSSLQTPLAFLETDNINYHLGGYGSGGCDELGAVTRPYQWQ